MTPRLPAFLLVVVALAFAGCGPTTYKSFCEHSASAICRAVFRCTPDDARAVWANIQVCTAEMSTRVDCGKPDAPTCLIDAGESSRCIDDLDNMICARTFVVPTSCDLQCSSAPK